VIVKVWPAIVIEPRRVPSSLNLSTSYLTVPLPLPPEVLRSIQLALDDADHVQPARVEIRAVLSPPLRENDVLPTSTE
jgi:hypothetical protein